MLFNKIPFKGANFMQFHDEIKYKTQNHTFLRDELNSVKHIPEAYK